MADDVDAVDENNTGAITQVVGKILPRSPRIRFAGGSSDAREAAEKHVASAAEHLCVARGRIGRQRAVSIRRIHSATLIQSQMLWLSLKKYEIRDGRTRATKRLSHGNSTGRRCSQKRSEEERINRGAGHEE